MLNMPHIVEVGSTSNEEGQLPAFTQGRKLGLGRAPCSTGEKLGSEEVCKQ